MDTYAALVATSFLVLQCVHNERVASLEGHAALGACVLSIGSALCWGLILRSSSLWLCHLHPSVV